MYGDTLMTFNPNMNCNIASTVDKTFEATYRPDKTTIRKVQECGVILFNMHLNDLLVVYQKKSNKWGFPKGYMTRMELYNKEYFNCAKRELMEETGIDLRTHRHTKYGTIIICNKLFYVIEIKKDYINVKPVDKNEIGTYKWIKRTDLLNFVQQNSCNITMKNLF
jgi:8-oxo-dGTP pyrophosphatase MutT (NUDIX family)